jgi:hypothetical protein
LKASSDKKSAIDDIQIKMLEDEIKFLNEKINKLKEQLAISKK